MSIFPAPLLLLEAVAERTRTLGLGIAIVLLPLSHPVRVAEEIAALDAISNGRVEFGIDQSESRERMMEALDLIRRAWTSERVSFEGQFYSVEDISDAQHGTVCGQGDAAFWQRAVAATARSGPRACWRVLLVN